MSDMIAQLMKQVPGTPQSTPGMLMGAMPPSARATAPTTPMVSPLNPEAAAEDAAIGLDFLAQVDIEQGKMEELSAWLADEIGAAKASRTELDEKLVAWQKQYEAIPNEKKKDWPWTDASNLTVAITASHVDQILGQLMNSVFGTEKLWAGRPRSAKQEWLDAAAPIEDWLNWMARENLGMYKVCQDWFLGMIKFGTGIVKTPWTKTVRKVIYKDGKGTVTEEMVVKHNGPEVQVVPLADFYVTSDAYTSKNVQTCEGVFHRYYQTRKQLEEAVSSKKFLDVSKVLASPRGQLTDAEAASNERMGVDVSKVKDFEIYECWVSYDIDGDGMLEELVVDYHLETRTVLRAVYNFYRHQERPFHLIRYMPRDNHLFGIGVCQMLEDVQTEVSTLHNLRLDNATIANTRMWKRVRGSQIEDVEVYPGAMVDVDKQDDLEGIQMGDIYPSMLREELHTNSLGERRTGVSDYTVGRESAAIGSRATATSTLALIQQGNKRFQMTINDIRQVLGDIAHQIIMLQQQFGAGDPVMYELFDEKQQQIVQKFFAMPIEFSRANVAIDVPAISEAENQDIDKQSLLSLMSLMQQFYMSMFQVTGMVLNPMAPPPMKELATQAATSASRLWERILTAFNIRDADTFVPNVKDMLMLGAAVEGLNGSGGAGGNPLAGGGEPAMAGGDEGAGAAAMLGALGAAGPQNGSNGGGAQAGGGGAPR